ncbi:hypothetical protein, partial [Enterobacter hormaechei]|uniref:hypothetical protein n=1 Tax=Enterobacter hormaechei TaxID=158836 RepID=UPI001953D064
PLFAHGGGTLDNLPPYGSADHYRSVAILVACAGAPSKVRAIWERDRDASFTRGYKFHCGHRAGLPNVS